MASADRLLDTTNLHGKLYDAESLLGVEKSVASGYVVLLNGGPASASTQATDPNAEDENLPLAFMSLTSGNVIDTCFGVVNPNLRGDSPSRRSAKEAKDLLGEHDTTDLFQRIAVSAYCEAFKTVIEYNEKVDGMNIFEKCFRSKDVRNEFEGKIKFAFDPLVAAIADAN